MNPTLTKQHLNVRFMRLGIQIIDQKNSQIYLMLYYHRRNLRISTERSGIHAGYICLYPMFIKRFFNQTPGSTGTYQMMFGKQFGVMHRPFDQIGLTIIMSNQCNSQCFIHNQHLFS